MPDARTHDLITVVTGALLVPPVHAMVAGVAPDPDRAALTTAVLVGAHLVSGILFSPDLDLDSAIDDRWGIFFWLWRPYMWAVPHRRFWSHSLVIAPLLRLLYFYAVVMISYVSGAWLLAQVGVAVPDYHLRASDALFAAMRANPDLVRAFLIGFITGSAAHTVADWSVTGGKSYLRALGIRPRRDYRDHDRWVPRPRRA